MTDGLFGNSAKFRICHRNFPLLKELPNILSVKEQHIRMQYRHETRILKCHEASRRQSPRRQNKTPVWIFTNETAQRLKVFFLLHHLQIIDKQDFPIRIFYQLLEQNPVSAHASILFPGLPDQPFRRHRLSKSAGCAEEKNPSPFHTFLKLCFYCWFYMNISVRQSNIPHLFLPKS